ncbi:methyl-accepting chemotaxis protein [Photobacterium sagamiensis]|uniref:methyl-accepting chemotaxis protein n=1 Tax=Photobacterium sagamiensis TaxID=2910241 RepID=UPI003D0B8970
MNRLTFKVKIFSIFFFVILATITASYFSVNHYISGYIYKNDTDNISKGIDFATEKLTAEFNDKIMLAKSLNSLMFTLVQIRDVSKYSGFSKVVKVIGDLVFTADGMLKDKNEAQHYIEIMRESNNDITVSDVFIEDNKQMVYITVNRGKNIVDIFYLEIDSIVNFLDNMVLDGSFIELVDGNNTTIFSNKIDSDLIEIKRPIDIQGKQWLLTGYIDKSYIEYNTRELNNSITIALLITAIIITPLCLLILAFAYKPIISLRNVVVELAKGNGDLTQRLDVKSNDDFGKMSDGINRFIINLQAMMSEISESTDTIGKKIIQLHQQTDSNQSLLASHAHETEQIVSAITEMSSSANSVTQSAVEAAKFARSADAEAQNSRQVVQNAVDSVSALVDRVERMTQSTTSMSLDVDKVGVILNVISDISNQTNLLALNAAIEAARAGEQGRGFSVVADEVRSLAARTQNSTEEIKDMLDKLKNGTKKMVESMEDTKESCQSAANNTGLVTSSLDVMAEKIVQVGELNDHIATAAEEQNAVTDEITRNILTIQNMIGKLNENGTATTESTQQLNTSNVQLEELVGRFRLS